MIEIIPAILPKNYEDLKDKIALMRGKTRIVQIDFCDGLFVPSKSWPFSTGGANDLNFQNIMQEAEGMPFWEDIDFEFDLMVADAIENFDIYTKLGAKRIVFHLEAVGEIQEFKNFIEGMDPYVRESLEIGIALNLNTSLERVFTLINQVDFIQCMGVEKVGFQGQEFSEKVLENIKILKEKFTDLIISVDGGVNLETAPLLIKAGATRLVIGSAILNSVDIIGTIEEFESLG